MRALALTRLVVAERRMRYLGLIAFAIVFILAGFAARALVGSPEGHVELGQLMLMGGYPLVSALLLLGWLLGRYPLIATLVLLAGVISRDRHNGHARIYASRPTSLLRVYAPRVLLLALSAFVLSAILMPTFDFLMLGEWNGPSTLVLIACYIIPYAGLTTLLSVFTRGEAWLTLLLALTAMVWDALRRGGVLDSAPPGITQVIAFILPPQGALFRIETAFAETQPLPWASVGYVIGYGVVTLVAAAVFLEDREL